MCSSDSVRVIRVSKQITPFLGSTTPTPSLKLTFYDIQLPFLPPTQRLLFYSTDTHFATLVDKLKESLSSALQPFYPLSGKLVWSPESDELKIQSGRAGDGVMFIEAETDGDFQRLVSESVHDTSFYQKLVPPLDVSELPAPLSSVQVTRFVSGGGVCIGVSIHHMAVDGSAFCHFLKSWAEICKSGEMRVYPSHDRSLILDPHGLYKINLDGIRTSLPKVNIQRPESATMVHRTFMLSAANIILLKERATTEQGEHSLGWVTTFVAVIAHAWACSVRARQVPDNEDVILMFVADCRSRLDPPMAQSYFGNCLKPCAIKAKAFELLGRSGFGFAVRAIQKLIRENLEEPLKDRKSWIREHKAGVRLIVGSSPRFKVYETDFGWGRPSRVEVPSANWEGNIVLAEKRDEEGGLQFSMVLTPPHMEEFANIFFDGLDGGDQEFGKADGSGKEVGQALLGPSAIGLESAEGEPMSGYGEEVDSFPPGFMPTHEEGFPVPTCEGSSKGNENFLTHKGVY